MESPDKRGGIRRHGCRRFARGGSILPRASPRAADARSGALRAGGHCARRFWRGNEIHRHLRRVSAGAQTLMDQFLAQLRAFVEKNKFTLVIAGVTLVTLIAAARVAIPARRQKAVLAAESERLETVIARSNLW